MNYWKDTPLSDHLTLERTRGTVRFVSPVTGMALTLIDYLPFVILILEYMHGFTRCMRYYTFHIALARISMSATSICTT